MNRKKLLALFVPAVLVLGLDQLTKWIVRTSETLQDYTIIEGWLEFYLVKNEGMAMGIDILPTWAISVIAILATVGILIYLFKTMKEAKIGYLICMGLVLGGAFGNISDRLFMGYVYGYGGVLEGHVIDFIHFSLRVWNKPVFPYIFNVADIAISVSIIVLFVFNRRLLKLESDEELLEIEMNNDEANGDDDLETLSQKVIGEGKD